MLDAQRTPLAIFLRFLRFGLLAWGGPFAQIAMLRRELVDEEHWIDETRFARVLGLYQMLPGPEAHELCVYFGMVARGRLGGFLAGLGFMLPGFLLMLAASWLYVRFGGLAAAIPLFWGLQPVVTAMITRAVFRIGTHVRKRGVLMTLAVVAFAGDWLGVNFLLMLAACGAVGASVRLGARARVLIAAAALLAIGVAAAAERRELAPSAERVAVRKASMTEITLAGTRAGLLTFGGAYTAVPIMREDAVEKGRWIGSREFLDSIAIGGILPAPMIIFTTFLGFIGGGAAGALVMTIAVFLPAFVMTLFFHHRLERIVAAPQVHGLLDGVTAGVVGLIAATALRVGLETITSAAQLVLFAVALLALFVSKSRWAVFHVVAAGAIAGLALSG